MPNAPDDKCRTHKPANHTNRGRERALLLILRSNTTVVYTKNDHGCVYALRGVLYRAEQPYDVKTTATTAKTMATTIDN